MFVSFGQSYGKWQGNFLSNQIQFWINFFHLGKSEVLVSRPSALEAGTDCRMFLTISVLRIYLDFVPLISLHWYKDLLDVKLLSSA